MTQINEEPVLLPHSGEELPDYMKRCMHDMKWGHKKRFTDNKQRVAICLSTYAKANEQTDQIIDKYIKKLFEEGEK